MTLQRHATELEIVSVTIPPHALDVYAAAVTQTCGNVGFFFDETSGLWTVEGVKDQSVMNGELDAAFALAAAATGVAATVQRRIIEAEGWLARSHAAFPEQIVGRRFAIRGTHLHGPRRGRRITLVLDAGGAFGSGEHSSTRGCLMALELMAPQRPRRILDLGTGSGILAMAAARLWHRRVVATDIDPWSVRIARENAARNGLTPMIQIMRADGWRNVSVRRGGPYDLVFANILARPLTRMARDLAFHIAPGGTAILSGMLASQARWVLAAHRRCGLVLTARLNEGNWTTLLLSRRTGKVGV